MFQEIVGNHRINAITLPYGYTGTMEQYIDQCEQLRKEVIRKLLNDEPIGHVSGFTRLIQTWISIYSECSKDELRAYLND